LIRAITDPNGKVWSRGFDSMGRLISGVGGAGNMNVQVTADGIAANPVQVTIQ
jgi:hypothetical protein